MALKGVLRRHSPEGKLSAIALLAWSSASSLGGGLDLVSVSCLRGRRADDLTLRNPAIYLQPRPLNRPSSTKHENSVFDHLHRNMESHFFFSLAEFWVLVITDLRFTDKTFVLASPMLVPNCTESLLIEY